MMDVMFATHAIDHATELYSFPLFNLVSPSRQPHAQPCHRSPPAHLHRQQKLLDAGSMPIIAEVPAVQREVRRLKERGVDIVIALGSAGHRRNTEIARSVRGLDAVVTAPVETRAANTDSFPQAVRLGRVWEGAGGAGSAVVSGQISQSVRFAVWGY